MSVKIIKGERASQSPKPEDSIEFYKYIMRVRNTI